MEQRKEGYSQVWRCNGCNRIHESEPIARACSESTDPVQFNIGDIVTSNPRYGWYNGDSSWLTGQTATSGHTTIYQFYHVVTHIDFHPYEPHKIRYHITTKAVFGRDENYSGGWTNPKTHYNIELVESPPEHIREAAAALIGVKHENLY